MEFPSTLNSYHRSCAHRFCDDKGLSHESHGTGWDRRLVITKIEERVRDDDPEKNLNVKVRARGGRGGRGNENLNAESDR